MTRVTRYLLVSRVERESKNDLKWSLLGSDRPSGLYNLIKPSWWCQPNSYILCCLGMMAAFKESDLGSASSRRFPSRRKSLESVK